MIKNFFSKIKNYFFEVLVLRTTPQDIALGFAIGTFIAVLPTFGLGVFIGLGVVLVYKKLSKVSMLLAFGVWNAAVLLPIYLLSYRIGDWIFSGEPSLFFQFDFLNQVYLYTRRFLVGNLLLAILFSVISYFAIFWFVKYYQEKQPVESIVEMIEESVSS